jgi:phospholipid/cholesterol/gamma-HCH transport system substrate-binding protein
METRANYVVIGLFTLAVIAGAFGFVYWFSRAGDGSERATYRVVFDGAVAGLRTGGWVLFNGIKVGEVSDLKLNPQNPRQVVATILIDKFVPVRTDTRVGLDFQGLTGIASIAIKGGEADATPLVGENGQPPTLVARPRRHSGRDRDHPRGRVQCRRAGAPASTTCWRTTATP